MVDSILPYLKASNTKTTLSNSASIRIDSVSTISFNFPYSRIPSVYFSTFRVLSIYGSINFSTGISSSLHTASITGPYSSKSLSAAGATGFSYEEISPKSSHLIYFQTALLGFDS